MVKRNREEENIDDGELFLKARYTPDSDIIKNLEKDILRQSDDQFQNHCLANARKLNRKTARGRRHSFNVVSIKMKRDREDNEQSDVEMAVPKIAHLPEVAILKNLEKDLKQQTSQSIDQQLAETQKHYFTMYMEKLMQEIPMGKAVVESMQKNGHGGDFVYMYTASKTIVQSIMSVNKHKALKSMMDMAATVMCRYMHDKVVSPMLSSSIHEDHLKNAFESYQRNARREENETELEMRCLLHTIHQVLEEDQQAVDLVNPFQVQITQQMKAISEYVVTLLTSFSLSSIPPKGKVAVTSTTIPVTTTATNTATFTTTILKTTPPLDATSAPSAFHATPFTLDATTTTTTTTPAFHATPSTFHETPSTVDVTTPSTFHETPSTVDVTTPTFHDTPSTVDVTIPKFHATPSMVDVTTPALEATPSTFDATAPAFKATPSTFDIFETTPSTANTFETTPSTDDTFDATPSTANTFETTPSTVNTFETTPSTDDTFDATPSTVNTFETTPSTEDETIYFTEDTFRTIHSTVDHIEATPFPSNTSEMTSFSTDILESTPFSDNIFEATLSSAAILESIPSPTDTYTRVIPSPTNNPLKASHKIQSKDRGSRKSTMTQNSKKKKISK